MIRYQLNKIKNIQDFSLQLCIRNHVVREWSGEFAVLIWKKTIREHMPTSTKLELDKKQLHQFYVDLTCLYQQVIVEYNIDRDLIKNKVPSEFFATAQSLLLQIRINQNHPSYDDLLGYFCGEFNHSNKEFFDKTISFLTNKNLIKSIQTEDGLQFFDKNISSHDHLYFKKYGKLVDCSLEFKKILKSINCPHNIKQDYSKLYTLNSFMN